MFTIENLFEYIIMWVVSTAMRKNLELYVKVTTNICYKITVRKKLIYSVNSGLQ